MIKKYFPEPWIEVASTMDEMAKNHLGQRGWMKGGPVMEQKRKRKMNGD